MIEFKKNVEELLPYDRRRYVSRIKWYGVSFQLLGGYEGRKISLAEYLDAYETWFERLILKFDNSSCFIVNHDCIDDEWLPNEDDSLESLRTLFKENNIPNGFKGAIVFKREDLLRFSEDLISYPSAVFKEDYLYENLDISYSELPFIIKISGHMNIDLLSTDKKFLKKVVDENASDTFIIREYRGTSLEV